MASRCAAIFAVLLPGRLVPLIKTIFAIAAGIETSIRANRHREFPYPMR